MKRLAGLVVLFILCFSLITGCGISKDSYDAAVKEANELKVQLSNVQADLATAQADLNKCNSDLMAARENLSNAPTDCDSILNQLEETEADLRIAETNLASAQSDLSKSNTELATTQQTFIALNNSVKTYQPYVDASALWLDAFANYTGWDQSTWDTWRVKMATAVSENQELQAAWNKIGSTTGTEHEAAETAFTELLLQRLNELIPETQ